MATCIGYFVIVLARLGSHSTIVICIEAEDHYNWLHTSSCSVWESHASPRRDIPTAFMSSLILTLGLFAYDLDLLRGVLFFR